MGRSDREPVDLRRLVAGFLRMAPDVAIVGEVRDRKALPELPAHVATVVQLATTLANGLSSTLRDAHVPLFGHGRGPFGFQSCALQVERIAATALALSRVSPPVPSQCHVKRILSFVAVPPDAFGEAVAVGWACVGALVDEVPAQ